ncbi:MAG: class I SAM-dependent methyltransferase [Nocardioides sp.]
MTRTLESTAPRRGERSFSEVFAQALAGHPCTVTGLDADPRPLPMSSWTREADDHDQAMLDLCVGATLDIGCGPGRLTSALTRAGQAALGIDVVAEAVGQTRSRGGPALQRDVFDQLPAEGRWGTALLADGNIGIGGDPAALLVRARDLVAPSGRIVVEVAPPGIRSRTVWATLECGDTASRPFRWAIVGADAITSLATTVGLAVLGLQQHGERWSAVLQVPL